MLERQHYVAFGDHLMQILHRGDRANLRSLGLSQFEARPAGHDFAAGSHEQFHLLSDMVNRRFSGSFLIRAMQPLDPALRTATYSDVIE